MEKDQSVHKVSHVSGGGEDLHDVGNLELKYIEVPQGKENDQKENDQSAYQLHMHGLAIDHTTEGYDNNFYRNEEYFIESGDTIKKIPQPVIEVSESGIKIENIDVYNGALPGFEVDQQEVPEEYEFYIYNLGNTKDGSHIAGPFSINSEVKPSLEAGEYVIRVLGKNANIMSEVSEKFFYDGDNLGGDVSGPDKLMTGITGYVIDALGAQEVMGEGMED